MRSPFAALDGIRSPFGAGAAAVGTGEYLFDLTHEWVIDPAVSGGAGMIRDVQITGPASFFGAGGTTAYPVDATEFLGTYSTGSLPGSGEFYGLIWSFDGDLSGDGDVYVFGDGITHNRFYWTQKVEGGKAAAGGRGGSGFPMAGSVNYQTWPAGKSGSVLYGDQAPAGAVLNLGTGAHEIGHWATNRAASDYSRDGKVLPDGRIILAVGKVAGSAFGTQLVMYGPDFAGPLATFDFGDTTNSQAPEPALAVSGNTLFVGFNTNVAPSNLGGASPGFDVVAGNGSFGWRCIFRFDISGNAFTAEYYTYLKDPGAYVAAETHGETLLDNGNLAFCGGNGEGGTPPTTAGALYADHVAGSSSGSAAIMAIMSPTLETLHYCTLFRGNTVNERTFFDGCDFDAARSLLLAPGASDSVTFPTTDMSGPGAGWAAHVTAFRLNAARDGLDADDPIAYCRFLAETTLAGVGSGDRAEGRRAKTGHGQLVVGGIARDSRITSGSVEGAAFWREVITEVQQPFQRAATDDGKFVSPDDLAALGITNQMTLHFKMTGVVNTTLFDLAPPNAGVLKAFVQADGALRITMGTGGGSDNLLSAAGTITAGTLHEIMIVFDGANNRQQIYVDGAKLAAASGTEAPGAYTFPATGIPLIFDGTAEIEQVHYVEIYATAALRQTGATTYKLPPGAPVKRILGPAATANADAWKAGADDFVPYVPPPPAPPVTAPTIETAVVDGISGSASTSVTITIPSSVTTGDWLLIGAVHRQDGTLSSSIGTAIGPQASDFANHELAVWKYQITGSDVPGTTTFTVSSTSAFTALSVCVVPVTGSGGVDDEARPGNYGAFGNTVTAPSTTSTQANSVAICFVSANTGATYTPQAGAVEIAEATTGTAGLYAFSYLQEDAGVVGTLTATIDGGGSSNHYGCTILMQGT